MKIYAYWTETVLKQSGVCGRTISVVCVGNVENKQDVFIGDFVMSECLCILD